MSRIASFIRDFFAPLEFDMSVRRRGFVGEPCPICGVSVHDDGEMCDRQCTTLCDQCGPVLADRFGNCPEQTDSTNHHCVELWPTKKAEWARMRKL